MVKQKNTRALVFYILLLMSFVGVCWLTLSYGNDDSSVQGASHSLIEAFSPFRESVQHHMSSTIGLLLMQILIILIAARGVGWLMRKMYQPAVVGEIVAGILLGPSLFGYLFPGVFAIVFPTSSLPNIQLLSNFGLILFMFVVGMELKLSDIAKQFKPSLIISHAGIFIPFALSLPISLYIYPLYAAEYTSFIPFALFVGIAVSITAFPVLARIIQENNLLRQPLGKLSLSTAASSDITAWLMLAGIIAISQSGSMLSTVYNVLFLLVYLGIMFGIIRPIFKIAGKVYDNNEVISHTLMGVIFILLLISAYVTELLSMHALFGAFILGLVMPEDLSFRKIVTDKVEDISLMLFLPLFFVSSGLQTQLGLIDTTDMWITLFIFIAIAVVGKVVGTYVSARACQIPSKESLYLGAFMNTRGLMELVVLAIGYEMGILPPNIYAVLVLMTVATTVMTMPLVQLINRIYRLKESRIKGQPIEQISAYKALISFGRPQSGVTLLRVTNQLLRRGNQMPQISALHITIGNDISTIDADKYYEDNFRYIKEEAKEIGIDVALDYRIADSVEPAIIDKLREERFSLLIIGAGIRHTTDTSAQEAISIHEKLSGRLGSLSIATTESLLSIRNLVRDKMNYFVTHAPCSVGILVGRTYSVHRNIILLVAEQADFGLLSYARAIAENSGALLTLVSGSDNIITYIQREQQKEERIISQQAFDEYLNYQQYDLMILSHRAWGAHYEVRTDVWSTIPSTLILSLQTPR